MSSTALSARSDKACAETWLINYHSLWQQTHAEVFATSVPACAPNVMLGIGWLGGLCRTHGLGADPKHRLEPLHDVGNLCKASTMRLAHSSLLPSCLVGLGNGGIIPARRHRC